jgi:hypothetical protein
MISIEVEAKIEYNKLIFTGELFSMFKNMTGEWNKDKDIFIEYFIQNKKAIEEAKKL